MMEAQALILKDFRRLARKLTDKRYMARRGRDSRNLTITLYINKMAIRAVEFFTLRT